MAVGAAEELRVVKGAIAVAQRLVQLHPVLPGSSTGVTGALDGGGQRAPSNDARAVPSVEPRFNPVADGQVEVPPRNHLRQVLPTTVVLNLALVVLGVTHLGQHRRRRPAAEAAAVADARDQERCQLLVEEEGSDALPHGRRKRALHVQRQRPKSRRMEWREAVVRLLLRDGDLLFYAVGAVTLHLLEVCRALLRSTAQHPEHDVVRATERDDLLERPLPHGRVACAVGGCTPVTLGLGAAVPSLRVEHADPRKLGLVPVARLPVTVAGGGTRGWYPHAIRPG